MENKRELFECITEILEETKVGVMTTVDDNNHPHARWMVLSLLKDSEKCFYAISSPNAHKCHDIKNNPNINLLIQDKALTKVISITGKAQIIDNPSLRAQVIENIGSKLSTFWRVNSDRDYGFIVIEILPEEANYLESFTGDTAVFKLD